MLSGLCDRGGRPAALQWLEDKDKASVISRAFPRADEHIPAKSRLESESVVTTG